MSATINAVTIETEIATVETVETTVIEATETKIVEAVVESISAESQSSNSGPVFSTTPDSFHTAAEEDKVSEVDEDEQVDQKEGDGDFVSEQVDQKEGDGDYVGEQVDQKEGDGYFVSEQVDQQEGDANEEALEPPELNGDAIEPKEIVAEDEQPLETHVVDWIVSEMQRLDQKHVELALDIIRQNEDQHANDDEEVELNFDSYNPSTLRKLHTFLNTLNEEKEAKPKKRVSTRTVRRSTPAARITQKGKRGRPKKSDLKPAEDEAEQMDALAETEKHDQETSSNLGVNEFNIGDEFLCLDTTDGLYREVKIVNIVTDKDEKRYRIHYKGWNANYDEHLTAEQCFDRFKAATKEDLAQAKREEQERRRQSKGPATPQLKTPTTSKSRKRNTSDAITPQPAKKLARKSKVSDARKESSSMSLDSAGKKP